MKNIYRLLTALIFMVGSVCALDLPEPPFGDEIEARMVEHYTIHIPVTGCVTGEFDRALSILQSSNVLEKIQIAYAALLPKGEKPEFEVQTSSEGHYYYVNRHQERSDIYEIKRKGGVESKLFEGVMYVQGERSFGMFESMITMHVSPLESSDGKLLQYNADVLVYPHCMALRVFLKYFPGVKSYFRSKTTEMQGIITGVFNHMIAGDQIPRRAAELAETDGCNQILLTGLQD